MTNIDLTPIIQAVIALVAALISVKLLPWLKPKASAEQLSALQLITKTLVFAAEQIYGSGTGEEKLKYVEEELKKRGFTVDRAMIEATVKELQISNTNKTDTLEADKVERPSGEIS